METYYQVEEKEGYYRIASKENVFSYLLVGRKKALLIDTGYGYGEFKETVRSVTDKPLIIVNTHGHCDHTGGNAQFEEPCYIHPNDINLCMQHNSPKMRRENVSRVRHSMDFKTGLEFDGLPEPFSAEEYVQMGAGILKPVSGGTCFDLGEITLEVIETPGHTTGGISLLYKEKNLLFIGDAAGHFVWLFAEETTSREVYISTLEKMYGLNATGYIGGHNPEVIHREDFLLYIRAAKEADYEKGEPFKSFLGDEFEPRVCALDGMKLKDMFKPGFASVVISADK